jgi:hypothetical protein
VLSKTCQAEAATHPSDRRQTARYRAKRRIVRDIWIINGLLMLAMPHPAAVVILALAGSFLGFMILDETR